MSDCERLSDRMPDVALQRAAWSAEEAAHLASCADCRAEWDLVLAARRLEASAPSVDPATIAAAVQHRLASERMADRRSRWGWALGGRRRRCRPRARGGSGARVPPGDGARRGRDGRPSGPAPRARRPGHCPARHPAPGARRPACRHLGARLHDGGRRRGCRARADPRHLGGLMSRLLLSLLLVAGPAAPLLAQQPDSPPGGPALRERIERRFSERIKEELDLSDEQAAKLKEVAKENGSRRRDMRRRERALYAAIDQQLDAGEKADQDSVAHMTRELLDLRVEYAQSIRAGDGQAVVPYPGPAGQADDHARPPAPSCARDARRSASLPPPRPRGLDFRRLPQQERRDAPTAALDARLPRARGSRLRPDAGRLPRRGERHGGERSGALRRPGAPGGGNRRCRRRLSRHRHSRRPDRRRRADLRRGAPGQAPGVRLRQPSGLQRRRADRDLREGDLHATRCRDRGRHPGGRRGQSRLREDGLGDARRVPLGRRGARSRPADRRGDGGRSRRDPRRGREGPAAHPHQRRGAQGGVRPRGGGR